MDELLLIVTIAGQRVALRTSEVQSLVEIDTLAPVPRAPAHIAGLSALRSRVLTVIDCMHSLELIRDPAARPMHEAVVVEHEGHSYALAVDSVEDVVVAKSGPVPLRAGLGDGWERVSLGMVECDDGALLLVDVAALIAGPEAAKAA